MKQLHNKVKRWSFNEEKNNPKKGQSISFEKEKMTWSDYTSLIRSLLTDLGIRGILVGEVPIKFRLIGKKGSIFTRVPHLTFQDGARLLSH